VNTILRILLAAATLAAIAAVAAGFYLLVSSYPMVGIPLAVALLVWGLIRAYNTLMIRAERAYRQRKR
jgi:hypothetical protein